MSEKELDRILKICDDLERRVVNFTRSIRREVWEIKRIYKKGIVTNGDLLAVKKEFTQEDRKKLEESDEFKKIVLQCCSGENVVVEAANDSIRMPAVVSAVLSLIDTSAKECQALVLAPSREKALEVLGLIKIFGEGKNVIAEMCIGGTKVKENVNLLKEGCHVVVGTSGRVLDIIKREALNLGSLKIFALEGAKELLNDKFEFDVRSVYSKLPKQFQIILSTDIITEEMNKAHDNLMNKNIDDLFSNNNFQSYFIDAKTDEKCGKLIEICKQFPDTPIVVFLHERHGSLAKQVGTEFSLKEINAVVVTNEGKKKDRERKWQQFRKGQSKVLITTDNFIVNKIGLKVPVIVSYEYPRTDDDFRKRIYFNAKFEDDEKITVLTFIPEADKEETKLDAIKEKYGVEMLELPENLNIL